MKNEDNIKFNKDFEKKRKLADILKEIEVMDEKTVCIFTIQVYKGGIQTLNRNEELLIG